jgi:hypothetical protein
VEVVPRLLKSVDAGRPMVELVAEVNWQLAVVSPGEQVHVWPCLEQAVDLGE